MEGHRVDLWSTWEFCLRTGPLKKISEIQKYGKRNLKDFKQWYEEKFIDFFNKVI